MNKLLKNVDYNPQDLLGEVVKITNKHMEFVPGFQITRRNYDLINYKSKWNQQAGWLCYLGVGTKWMIWEVKGEDRDRATALIANFSRPDIQLWIPLEELERSARLLG